MKLQQPSTFRPFVRIFIAFPMVTRRTGQNDVTHVVGRDVCSYNTREGKSMLHMIAILAFFFLKLGMPTRSIVATVALAFQLFCNLCRSMIARYTQFPNTSQVYIFPYVFRMSLLVPTLCLPHLFSMCHCVSLTFFCMPGHITPPRRPTLLFMSLPIQMAFCTPALCSLIFTPLPLIALWVSLLPLSLVNGVIRSHTYPTPGSQTNFIFIAWRKEFQSGGFCLFALCAASIALWRWFGSWSLPSHVIAANFTPTLPPLATRPVVKVFCHQRFHLFTSCTLLLCGDKDRGTRRTVGVVTRFASGYQPIISIVLHIKELAGSRKHIATFNATLKTIWGWREWCREKAQPFSLIPCSNSRIYALFTGSTPAVSVLFVRAKKLESCGERLLATITALERDRIIHVDLAPITSPMALPSSGCIGNTFSARVANPNLDDSSSIPFFPGCWKAETTQQNRKKLLASALLNA